MQTSPKSRHRVHRVAVVSPVEGAAKAQTPATNLSTAYRGSTAGGSRSPWRRSTGETDKRSPLPSPFSVPDWTTVYKATGLTPTFFQGASSRGSTPAWTGHGRVQGSNEPYGKGEGWEKEDGPSTKRSSPRSVSCPPEFDPDGDGRFLGDDDGRRNSRGSRVQWRDDLTTDLGSKSTLSSPSAYGSVADFTRSVKGVPEGPRFLTAEISPTNRGGLRWKSELSRIGPQTDALYGDAAIAYMQEVGNTRASPPKPHWEQDEARHRLIEEHAKSLKRDRKPGSSWEMAPGQVPNPRALPGSPDRVGASDYINQRRRRMLIEIRKAISSTGADKYMVFMGAMWDADPDRTGMLKHEAFVEILKRFSYHVDAESDDMLCDLFAFPGRPGAELFIDYNKFSNVLFEVSADLKSFSKRPGDGDVKLTAEAMNQSSIKWDLRPRSKGSGRPETVQDWRKEGDLPLIMPSGSTKARAKYLFLTERELALQKGHENAPSVVEIEEKIEQQYLAHKVPEKVGLSHVFSFDKDPEQYKTLYRVDFEGRPETRDSGSSPYAKSKNKQSEMEYWTGPKEERRATAKEAASGPSSAAEGMASRDWDAVNPWETTLGQLGKGSWLPPEKPPKEMAWTPAHEKDRDRTELITDVSGMAPSSWSSTNLCNKDLPQRVGPAKLSEENDPRKRPVWTHQRPDCDYMPQDWASTSRQQQMFLPRQKTPIKGPVGAASNRLRMAPWSVQERHVVHLNMYDHKLVGLPRPQRLDR